MKRKLYFWAKKHVNSDNVKLVVLAIPLAIILVQQIVGGKFDWTEFFDVSILITFIILVISDVVAKIIQKTISGKTEDFAKLSNQYDDLVKKYKCTELMQFRGITYPEQCLWLRDGATKFTFVDESEKFYELPSQVADHSGEIMEAHSASNVFNKINIRLDDLEYKENELILHTSRTQYFDSLMTNRACDYVFSNRKITVRELYEPGPFLKPLHLSRLSNHIGYNGFVITSDTKAIPFILRKKNLSIAKNRWGTSVEASLKTAEALDSEHKYAIWEQSFSKAIIGELETELGITGDGSLSHSNIQKNIFAFYRDIVECGKPQFLFYLQLQDTKEDKLRKSIEGTKKSKKDRENVDSDGYKVRFFTLEQLKSAEFHVDKIVIKGKKYKMMPSSIVSVALLLKYMEEKEAIIDKTNCAILKAMK